MVEDGVRRAVGSLGWGQLATRQSSKKHTFVRSPTRTKKARTHARTLHFSERQRELSPTTTRVE
ncbi:unnamed protein product [Ectocarpus sp. 12 AP-2014]